MRNLIAGRTVVLVTHRPGPIALADQVVRLAPADSVSTDEPIDTSLATAAVNPW